MISPLKFKNRTCPICGVEQSVYPIDKLGRLTRNLDIFPLSKMKCSNCRAEFFIEWDFNNMDKPIPIPVSKELHFNYFIKSVEEFSKDYSRPALSFDKYDFNGSETLD